MPTLNWMGKEKVVNHHRDVPYRVLERVSEKGVLDSHGSDCGNMIIHGDNLEALKALLPEYEGKIKCIFIDPPYNTGEEGWVYNDNVNDPRIRKWLGQVVGKEGEDFSRHDKWLCMMYPRLRLLQKLLAKDGIISVAIDDNEVFNLGEIMNEIFGASNRLACAPWLSEPSGGKEKTKLRNGHEYILIYTNGSIESLSRDVVLPGKLTLKDSKGPYKKGRELRKWGGNSQREDRPNQWFGVTAPDGTVVYPYKNDGTEGHWRWSRKNPGMQEILRDPEYAYWELCPYDKGVVVNGETERWVPFEKIRQEKRSIGWATWLDKYGYNSDATAELKAIFGSKPFDTPKPLVLISWIVSLYDASDEDVFILDSFAGSGTTAHAVLNVNKGDGGHRHFIMVEMMDYADNITAERVRRVIHGYGEGKSAVAGIDSGFSYYELGPELFRGDGTISSDVTRADLARYVWATETRAPYKDFTVEHPYLLGEHAQAVYYLAWEPGEETTLTYDLLRELPRRGAPTVIYADRCVIAPERLDEMNVVFKRVPDQIARI